MNLERAQELLALRLYDELSGDESRALDRFLAGSEAGRAWARELDAGLGTLRDTASREAPPEWPDDWSERLRARIDREPRASRPRLLRPLATFLAGLAAGLLLTWSFFASPSTPAFTSAESAPIDGDAGPQFVLRSAPPPPATGGSPLSRRGVPSGR